MEYIKKGLLEAARVAAFWLMPVLVEAVQTGKFDVKIIAAGVVVSFFKGLDKYIHENPDIELKGITPF